MGSLVLVIDDSKFICKIIEVVLHREGYEVVCCLSGEAAIRWLASSDVRIPDLVFVDLCFPQMDGFSVIRHLRSQSVFSQTPFVILSRRNGMLDKLKGRLVGASDYLAKPFTTEQIITVVKTHLGIPVSV